MVIETKLVRIFGAVAITIWPIILIAPDAKNIDRVIKHELVHIKQQRKWAIYGLIIPGLLAWYFTYFLSKYFRYKWETEAFKAIGFSDKEIKEILEKTPCY